MYTLYVDTAQLVITISIISVSVVVVACGIWLILILSELKATLKKANTVIDDTKTITGAIVAPASSISEFVMGFKNGLQLFNRLFPNNKSSQD